MSIQFLDKVLKARESIKGEYEYVDAFVIGYVDS